jgi:agmatinase
LFSKIERIQKAPFLAAGVEDRAELVLLGVPLDHTTSFRPGARFGPEAVRGVSESLEEYSYYQDADLREMNFADLGDLLLPPGNVSRALELVEEAARVFFRAGKVPFFLGGEHLLSYATVRAATEVFPDLVVLCLDAHTDLRPAYLGEELSHASAC